MSTNLEVFIYILENGPIKRTEIIKQFNKHTRSIDRYLSDFKRSKLIVSEKRIHRNDPVLEINWVHFDEMRKKEKRKGIE